MAAPQRRDDEVALIATELLGGAPSASALLGLSVICVQKVPLRKAREINALRHGVALNQLK
jgi:hypothetical protein